MRNCLSRKLLIRKYFLLFFTCPKTSKPRKSTCTSWSCQFHTAGSIARDSVRLYLFCICYAYLFFLYKTTSPISSTIFVLFFDPVLSILILIWCKHRYLWTGYMVYLYTKLCILFQCKSRLHRGTIRVQRISCPQVTVDAKTL